MPSAPRPPWSAQPCLQTRGCHIRPPWSLVVGNPLGWLWEESRGRCFHCATPRSDTRFLTLFGRGVNASYCRRNSRASWWGTLCQGGPPGSAWAGRASWWAAPRLSWCPPTSPASPRRCSWGYIIISSVTCGGFIQYIDANIESLSKPEYVHLWPLLSVFEFELVWLNNALHKEKCFLMLTRLHTGIMI